MKRIVGMLGILAGLALLGFGNTNGFAAVAAGFALLAWDSVAKRKRSFSFAAGIKAIGLALLLVGVVVPAGVGCVHLLDEVLERLFAPTEGAAFADFILVLTGIATIVLVALYWPLQVRDRWFLALLSLIFVVAKIIYVTSVEMPALSDFGIMWNLSGEIAEHGWPSEGINIFQERSIPYLLPLRALFGPSSSSYSIANVIVGLASSLLTYKLARHWFGRRAARVTFILSQGAVETWMASEIPTHDIPGTFYALLGITLYVFALRLWRARQTKRAVILMGAFGVVALILELQRTTGPFLIVTCGLFGIASLLTDPAGSPVADKPRLTLRRLSWVTAIFMLLPFGVYKLLDTALVAQGLASIESNIDQRRTLVIAAMTDSWGDASWGYFQYNYNAPYGHLPLHWGKFAAVKLASDTARFPLSRASLYLRKSRTLFDLGSQTGFYVSSAEIAGGAKIDIALELRFLQASRTFALIFLILFLIGVVQLFAVGQPQIEWFVGIAYISLIPCVLLIFGEVQPRYIYPIWYFGAIYAGAVFRSNHAGTSNPLFDTTLAAYTMKGKRVLKAVTLRCCLRE